MSKLLTAVLVSLVATGCSSWYGNLSRQQGTTAAQPVPLQSPNVAASPVTASTVSADVASDPYQQAIDRASSAYMFSQSAQSGDDWQLVVSRWQQAINLMMTVPKSSPHYLQVDGKLTQYRRNLIVAQQKANRPFTVPNSPIVVHVSSPPTDSVAVVRPPATPAASTVPTIAAAPAAPPVPQPDVFTAPIVRRAGNTPVIRVRFNDSQDFDMILDTGASGTLITQQMASALGIVPVSQTTVDTASAQKVSFPLGYVQSIEAGGAVAHNVLVAVAGPELSLGLLGHDFFGTYDVTIRENQVEFHQR